MKPTPFTTILQQTPAQALISAFGLALLALNFLSCAPPLTENEKQELKQQQLREEAKTKTRRANEHVRTALMLLNEGEDEGAEIELRSALDLDSKNTTARISLASIYVKRSGIELDDWLKPLWLLGKEIGEIQSTSEETAKLAAALYQKRAATAGDQLFNALDADMIEKIFRAFHVTRAVVKIFQLLPELNKKELNQIDRAISILREDNPISVMRPQEIGNYLSTLGLIRLVTFTKKILGSTIPSTLAEAEKNICALSLEQIDNHLNELRTSAQIIEEGLLARGESPEMNKKTKRKIWRVINNIRTAPYFDEIARFREKSLAPATETVAAHICKEGHFYPFWRDLPTQQAGHTTQTVNTALENVNDHLDSQVQRLENTVTQAADEVVDQSEDTIDTTNDHTQDTLQKLETDLDN